MIIAYSFYIWGCRVFVCGYEITSPEYLIKVNMYLFEFGLQFKVLQSSRKVRLMLIQRNESENVEKL